jgi:transcription-repair coupling factor (superfamily II helicase)
MSVAMKDLEIRGAGNLLGAEQSGHIADVGFDLYVRLVSEAVSELRSEPDASEPADVKIELPLDAHIPVTYIEQERLRLEAYKRIAASHTDEQIDEFAEELLDRYGNLPESVSLLLEVARLRAAARAAGLSEVMLAGSSIRLAPAELPESRQVRLSRLYPGAVYKPVTHTILVPAARTAKVGGVVIRNHELVAWVREMITAVFA